MAGITLAQRSRALIDERFKAVLVDLSWGNVQPQKLKFDHRLPPATVPPPDLPLDGSGGADRRKLAALGHDALKRVDN